MLIEGRDVYFFYSDIVFIKTKFNQFFIYFNLKKKKYFEIIMIHFYGSTNKRICRKDKAATVVLNVKQLKTEISLSLNTYYYVNNIVCY